MLGDLAGERRACARELVGAELELARGFEALTLARRELFLALVEPRGAARAVGELRARLVADVGDVLASLATSGVSLAARDPHEQQRDEACDEEPRDERDRPETEHIVRRHGTSFTARAASVR